MHCIVPCYFSNMGGMASELRSNFLNAVQACWGHLLTLNANYWTSLSWIRMETVEKLFVIHGTGTPGSSYQLTFFVYHFWQLPHEAAQVRNVNLPQIPRSKEPQVFQHVATCCYFCLPELFSIKEKVKHARKKTVVSRVQFLSRCVPGRSWLHTIHMPCAITQFG